MLINLSNHPSALWSQEQINAASVYGEIFDISFPAVNPDATPQEIASMAEKLTSEVLFVLANKKELNFPSAVHIMGELSLCFSTIIRLQKNHITCLCATTTRMVITDENNNKISQFCFHNFRPYELFEK